MSELVSQRFIFTNEGTAPAVDAYIANAAPFARPILQHLRDVVHQAVPGVREAIKWSHPFFLYRGIILGNMSAFRHHCSFDLWGESIAAAMRSDGFICAGAMGSLGRIASLQDLPRRATLMRYVRIAAQAVDDGDRTTSFSRAKVSRSTALMPEVLTEALTRNEVAAQNFRAMSPSWQREYGEWIAGAKREETRQRRLAFALEWISEGKPRNWKYDRA
jgi:hypothetical protein